MRIKVTVTYEMDADLESWPEDERSFAAIKEYIEGDNGYFFESDPASVVIEQIGD